MSSGSGQHGWTQPLTDDTPPGEVGALDAEAAVLQGLWKRVPQGDLCSHLAFLLWFPEDLGKRATQSEETDSNKKDPSPRSLDSPGL